MTERTRRPTATVWPWGPRVLVADTNFLARTAWWIANHQGDISTFEETIAGGRSHAYIASHVPDEMPRAIARIGRGRDPAPALDAWKRLATGLRVVELELGDHLDPAISYVLRKDADDLPTAALAKFLAPSVLLTSDGVFAEAGLSPLQTPRQGVLAVKRITEQDAHLEGAFTVAAVTGGVAVEGVAQLVRLARRQPGVGAMVVLGVGLASIPALTEIIGGRRRLRPDLRTGLAQFVRGAGRIASEMARIRAEAEAAVVEVPRLRSQRMEEAAAAILARHHEPLGLRAVRHELGCASPRYSKSERFEATHAELREVLQRHPAFVPSRRGWSLGQPVFEGGSNRVFADLAVAGHELADTALGDAVGASDLRLRLSGQDRRDDETTLRHPQRSGLELFR